MNPLLEQKLNSLKAAHEFECWYLVKHSTNFANLCYLVSFLKDYVEHPGISRNLESHIEKRVAAINTEKPYLKLSNNYRALRVAAFFGLIKMTSAKYDDCIFTDTYNEVATRCSGAFENTDLYQDIITRQIEKMYVASTIDEAKADIRKDYAIFPIMFLNKVLIELGRTTGSYSISMNEYRYLVATTKRFDDYLETMLYIKLLRDEADKPYNGTTVLSEFKSLRDKFDNRMNKAIELLEYIDSSNDCFTIKSEYVDAVAKKVYEFENSSHEMDDEQYIDFLCSTKSFFDEVGTMHIESDDEREMNVKRINGGTNVILYGVPGAGKSWTIKNHYCSDESLMERLVFHPDYTYSDFVGQIIPKLDADGNVNYVFNPGPFTKIVKKAYGNPNKMFYLVIEEINRGNAPAIFGDIFQLLDRDANGTSEYAITNADIAKVVYGDENHKVKIPSNLTILCTMNTSDQNVFTLDTAFQRRWNMRLIQNKFLDDANERTFAETKILDTDVTWEKFFTEINAIILKKNIRMTSSEDKRLGTHFIKPSDLVFVAGDIRQNSMFAEKVLKYLWDDAFKFNKDELFDISKVVSLEDVIDKFVGAQGNQRFVAIFKQNIYDTIIPKIQPNT